MSNDTSDLAVPHLDPSPPPSDPDNDLICFVNDYETLDSFSQCVREQALSRMRYMSPSQAALFTFLYVLISAIGIVGNGLVIFAVARKKEMRTNRNVFIVNLALSNFVLALILVPFLWMPTYKVEFPYGAFMCKVAQAFPGANIFCSTLSVSCIAVDRYYAVVRTRSGPGTMKVLQATLIALSIWIVSFLLSILYLLHFDIKDYTLPAEYIPKRFFELDNGAWAENISQSHMPPAVGGLLLFERCELQPAPCLDQDRVHRTWNNTEACYKFYETAVSSIMAGFIYFVPMPILVVFSVLLTRFLHKNERQHSILLRGASARSPVAAAPQEHTKPDEEQSTALLSTGECPKKSRSFKIFGDNSRGQSGGRFKNFGFGSGGSLKVPKTGRTSETKEHPELNLKKSRTTAMSLRHFAGARGDSFKNFGGLPAHSGSCGSSPKGFAPLFKNSGGRSPDQRAKNARLASQSQSAIADCQLNKSTHIRPMLATPASSPNLLVANKPINDAPPTAASKSAAAQSRHRRSRTTSLLFAMAFGNALLWLPFTFVSLFIQLAPVDLTRTYTDVLRQLDDAAKLISMLSICVNPFLYGYLNTNFKREFKLIFRKCFPWCCRRLGGDSEAERRRHTRTSSAKSAVQMMTTPAGTTVYREKEGADDKMDR